MQGRPTRDITTLPLPPTLKNKIVQAGFRDVRDFDGYRPVELAKGEDSAFTIIIFNHSPLLMISMPELRVTQEEALSILRTIKENTGATTAPAGSLFAGASSPQLCSCLMPLTRGPLQRGQNGVRDDHTNREPVRPHAVRGHRSDARRGCAGGTTDRILYVAHLLVLHV